MAKAKKKNTAAKKKVRQRKLSDIDLLYKELYGEQFAKAGTAYERLSAGAISYLSRNPALYNQFVTGISGEVKQVDGVLLTPEGSVMIEAKDYGIRNAKVGYEDIAKLEGSLTDMNMASGILASATDFTKPTKQFAIGTRSNDKQMPITLYNIRRSTEEDRKGRVETIVYEIHFAEPDFAPNSFQIDFTKEAEDQLRKDFMKEGEASAKIRIEARAFYDKNGNEKISIRQISENVSKMVDLDNASQIKLEGFYALEDCYAQIEDKLYPISGLKYKVPILRGCITSEIKGGKPVLFVKSDDGKYDKLITEDELKSISFEDGNVVITDPDSNSDGE